MEITKARHRGAWVLATSLAGIACLLAWSIRHIHYDVLRSQQPCDTTYMYPMYTRVEMSYDVETGSHPASGGIITANGSASTHQQQHNQHSVPAWAEDLALAAGRLTAAVGALGRVQYGMWRYTEDDAGGQGSRSRDRSGGRSSGLALPVLFIPGHGGSHEMARSLAFETARQAARQAAHPLLGSLRGASQPSLDWFLLDLGGEWSAFGGETLEAQVRFTLTAMRYLAMVYNITAAAATAAGASDPRVTGGGGGADAAHASSSSSPPRAPQLHPGMLVAGHSMGGVVAAEAVARAATDPQLGPSAVALLLTHGSPHTRPVLPGHPSLRRFYSAAAARTRPVVPVVALAGGLADVQVAAVLTDPSGLAPEGFTRALALPQLPGGWCPAGHSALTSCNQAMLPLARALVEIAQDAVPSLKAARKAAATAAHAPPSTAPSKSSPPPPSPNTATSAAAPAGTPSAALGGEDEDLRREGHRPDSLTAAAAAATAAVYGNAGGGDSLLSWDWTLRRMDQQLTHPAQGYLAAAIAATAANAEAEEARESEIQRLQERQRALVRQAEAAMAPASSGGAGCSGANLAWHLQYGKPQLLPQPYGKKRSNRSMTLRLMPHDTDNLPSTGRKFAWQLAARGPGGGGGSMAEKVSVGGGKEERAGGGGGVASGGNGGGGGGLRPQGWVAVVSGATPCSAFRAWVSVTIEQQQQLPAKTNADAGATTGTRAGGPDGGGGGGGGGGDEQLAALAAEARRSLAAPGRTVRHDVEVTGLAAPLPAVVREGRWPTRVASDWPEIMRGRDYQSRASWLLLLPPSLVLPLLQQSAALPLDWAADGDGRTVTVSLTLWVGEPSYKPAFRVVAAPLPPPPPPPSHVSSAATQSAEAEEPPPPPPLPLSLQPFQAKLLPKQLGSGAASARGAGQASASGGGAPSPLPPAAPVLVPLDLPYLFPSGGGDGGGDGGASSASAAVAAVVQWLGLYRYAAVRIVNLEEDQASAAAVRTGAAAKSAGSAAEAAATAEGTNGRCLYPVVILVGSGGTAASAGDGSGSSGAGEGARTARLLQVGSNHTLHSLEPCATDPWGCTAAAAVLDPACSYRIDLVPYVSQRLAAVLMAELGRLWLGMQLVALLGLLAATVSTTCKSMTIKAAPAAAEAATAAVANVMMPGRGGGAAALPQRRRRLGAWLLYWFQRRLLSLPLEGLHVLQAGLVPRWTSLLAACLAASAAAATCLLHCQSLLLSSPDEAGDKAHHRAHVVASALRQAVVLMGLCPQLHQPDCGLRLASLLPSSAGMTSTAAAAAAAAAAGGTSLAVLDYAALAATALLAAWVLAVALAAAAAVIALAEALVRQCWRLLFVLPLRVLLAPLSAVVRCRTDRRRCRRDGTNDSPKSRLEATSDNDPAAAAAPAGDDEGLTAVVRAAAVPPPTAERRWQVARLVLTASLMALAGAPYEIPAAALLTSAVSLALAVASPLTAAAAAPPPPLLRRLDRQRQQTRLAWLLYYATYGSCAAPAVAAVLRRLVSRPAAAMELLSACGDVAAEVLALLAGGRSLDGLQLAWQWVAAAVADAMAAAAAAAPWSVAAAAAAVIRSNGGQLGYVLAAVHCSVLAWGAAAPYTVPSDTEADVDTTNSTDVLSSAVGAAAGVAGTPHPQTQPPPLPAAISTPPSAAAAAAATQGAAKQVNGKSQDLNHSSAAAAAAVAVGASVCSPGVQLGVGVTLWVGAVLLGTAWWLGSVDAAHVAAGALAATQLLLLAVR